MRNFRSAVIVVFAVLIYAAAPAFASHTAPLPVANDYLAAMQVKYAPAEAKQSRIRVCSAQLGGAGAPQFCGQCTTDEGCGVGYKCCGSSSCRQCFHVTECP